MLHCVRQHQASLKCIYTLLQFAELLFIHKILNNNDKELHLIDQLYYNGYPIELFESDLPNIRYRCIPSHNTRIVNSDSILV